MDLERTYQAYKDLGMGKKFEEMPVYPDTKRNKDGMKRSRVGELEIFTKQITSET